MITLSQKDIDFLKDTNHSGSNPAELAYLLNVSITRFLKKNDVNNIMLLHVRNALSIVYDEYAERFVQATEEEINKQLRLEALNELTAQAQELHRGYELDEEDKKEIK